MMTELADRMNWPEKKLKAAQAAWGIVRHKISLGEFLELLKLGYMVHRPEGYTYDWLRELMTQHEESLKAKEDA